MFMTSACVMLVRCAMSSMLSSSGVLMSSSTIVSAQYARYPSSPRSLSGFSGLPSLPSFLLSSYENSMSSFPYPCRWCCGSVRMHATLYDSADSFSFEKYPMMCAPVESRCAWWGVRAGGRGEGRAYHDVVHEWCHIIIQGFTGNILSVRNQRAHTATH